MVVIITTVSSCATCACIVIFREDYGFHVWHVPNASDRSQGGSRRCCAGLGIGQLQQRTAAAETVHFVIAVGLGGSRMEETVVMSGIINHRLDDLRPVPTNFLYVHTCMLQSRVRELLVSLLMSCGQRVGLPKSPSVRITSSYLYVYYIICSRRVE